MSDEIIVIGKYTVTKRDEEGNALEVKCIDQVGYNYPINEVERAAIHRWMTYNACEKKFVEFEFLPEDK